MCGTCGCSPGDDEHRHEEGGEHAHPHAHDHGHAPAPFRGATHVPSVRRVKVELDVLSKNARVAEANRALLAASRTLAVNLMSSPGSGKTTLLVQTLRDLAKREPIAVIEGDQQTSLDADRIRATGVPAVQINTGKGCHLDALMVHDALAELPLLHGGLLFIENVGNLVCPAGFDLGEGRRVVLFSVTEGEDKPLKYPDMFAGADLVIVNKVDLLPHLNVDGAQLRENVRRVQPDAELIELSAETGHGLGAWYAWLEASRRLVEAA